MTSKEYVTLRKAFLEWCNHKCALWGQNTIDKRLWGDETIKESDICTGICSNCSVSYGIKGFLTTSNNAKDEYEHHEEICKALLKWKFEHLNPSEQPKHHESINGSFCY